MKQSVSVMMMMMMMMMMMGSPASSFRLADTRVPVQRVPNSCVTQSGSNCVFPFKYNNVEYYQCTYADSPVPWCATGTDSTGTVIPNQWGDCVVSQVTSRPIPLSTIPGNITTNDPDLPDRPDRSDLAVDASCQGCIKLPV